MENFNNEIWKDIEGYFGKYQISNFGRVKSLERLNARGYRVNEKILKPTIIHNGYYQVQLCKNSIVKAYLIHRLVWETFNGAIPEGYELNHKSEKKSDNRLSNLNLVTHKENLNWGPAAERIAKKQSKPVLQFTLDGIFVKEYQSITQAYRETGFSQGNICNCCKGKYKTANGYIWRYKAKIEP